MYHEARRRVAVIGAGVSGLTAAYVLQRQADVTLYEADDRLGGHAHTHDVSVPDGDVAVDSGFIVHNRRTYPHLLRLFDELGVATQETEMSMSIRCLGCGLEYAGGRGVRGLFAQPSAVLRRSYLAMLARVPRLHRDARALLATDDDCTLGEFLARGGVPTLFRPALRHTFGFRGVVVRSARGDRVPGPVPVHLPRAPRDADREGLTGLANSGRRIQAVRGGGGKGTVGGTDGHTGAEGSPDRHRRGGP